MPGIKAFTAAVFGGIGSIPGAMLGGILLGVIEQLSKSVHFHHFGPTRLCSACWSWCWWSSPPACWAKRSVRRCNGYERIWKKSAVSPAMPSRC